MATKAEMLALVIQAAQQAGVAMGIGGGIAVHAHGYRRETADVDAFFHDGDQQAYLQNGVSCDDQRPGLEAPLHHLADRGGQHRPRHQRARQRHDKRAPEKKDELVHDRPRNGI